MIPRLDAATLERILGRPQREILTERDRAALRRERVVITGGGGSVGSELARLVASCDPEALVLVDQSEYNLFTIEQELRQRWPHLPLDVVLGDVSRMRIMRQACEIAHPTVLYHAAAYKHVTMVERAIDPAIETNVFGTLAAARVAREAGARFVLVSSDKAAAPASVMGATKRLAELVALSLERRDFRPVAVRFGNVLGSSGSLLEIVLECIRDGRPIPLTDPKATRYFMTGPEAAALVLKADRVGAGGEIFWLDMGEPVAIIDIIDRTRHFALEAGLRPVPVQVVGLRPGEKLREELTSQGLELCRTTHRRIWKARQPEIDAARIRRLVRALRYDLRAGDLLAALQDLSAAVPEYTPSRSAWQRATGTSLEPVLQPAEPLAATWVA